MKISNYIKTLGLTLAIAAPMYKAPLYAQLSEKDRFEKVVPPPEGSSDSAVLNAAPNPEISINGKVQNAVIVVDLSKNVLFKYDSLGVAEKAYLIASGKPNTPTDKGVRIVTHIEKYPYRTAPKSTKRRKNPGAYGPNIICLNKINVIFLSFSNVYLFSAFRKELIQHPVRIIFLNVIISLTHSQKENRFFDNITNR